MMFTRKNCLYPRNDLLYLRGIVYIDLDSCSCIRLIVWPICSPHSKSRDDLKKEVKIHVNPKANTKLSPGTLTSLQIG